MNEKTYNQQIAEWANRKHQEEQLAQAREAWEEVQQAVQERDDAIINGDDDAAWDAHKVAVYKHQEFQQLVPQQPPQMDPRLQKFHAANKNYIDALISKHGNEKASAFLSAVDARLTAPRNLQEPAKGGLGLARYSPEYFARGRDFLELYSEGTSGVAYEPDGTLTADEAARISGVSPQQYNKSAQVMQQQGRFTWQNRK
jgi:hypothetical protein